MKPKKNTLRYILPEANPAQLKQLEDLMREIIGEPKIGYNHDAINKQLSRLAAVLPPPNRAQVIKKGV